MIDRDEVTFTADVLRAMKCEHEESIQDIQRNATFPGISAPDFIAIGSDIVFTGDFLGMEGDEWIFHLRNFLDGNVQILIAFIERFEQAAVGDRYVLVNSLGDGRVLKNPPSMFKENGGYVVRCPVLPRTDRIRAADLPKRWALSNGHDLAAKDANWASVSGLEALPDQVKTCLSLQKGESPLHRDFGTRFAEYYRLLSGSPWLGRYMKLEVIRQAAIPYSDTINARQYTPLLCVEYVLGIEILADAPIKNWLPIRVELDVKGLGRWEHDLFICVPQKSVKRASLDELIAGPSDP
jgi:hypothetical protein